ncbi:MAG: glycosyltransferase family 1 protein [Rhodocyclaceae bacterium]|nr:glycosyltransferase family 1 protein [Rhodocyclaceae bacterium]
MNKSKILLDLKPALDGYAGIPQETRLLFAGLCRLQSQFNVEGLLQHGSATLNAAAEQHGAGQEIDAEVIVNHARSVISFYGGAKRALPAAIRHAIKRYVELQKMRWRATTKKEIELGVFEPGLFDDFIWSRLFSKTLSPEQKALVTSVRHRVLRPSRRMLHEVGMRAFSRFHSPTFLAVDTREYAFFLAQTPFPGRVSPETRLIVRYHDAVPVTMPHTIGDKSFHLDSHFLALRDNVAAGAWFACISEATRQDLIKLFPEVEERSTVIHNMVSGDYRLDDTDRRQAHLIMQVRQHQDESSQQSRQCLAIKEKPYLLMVSTLEPRKNHQLLLSAWARLKFSGMDDLRLVVVGNPGWDCKPILQSFQPWIHQGDLLHLSNVPAAELRVLYRHAAATICPSVAEGFDYSGVEAMCCGGLVIASDIPVHREIFAKAAVYIDPYCPEDAAAKIRHFISPQGQPEANVLRAATPEVTRLFSQELLLSQWQAFFDKSSIKMKFDHRSGTRA